MTISEENLIKQFVESWSALEDEPHPEICFTHPDELKTLNAFLPNRLPSLFEKLVSNFHWCEVHFENFRLLPNQGIDSFKAEIVSDKILSGVLLSNGLIQFARAVDGAFYDPICFDTRNPGKDYSIVRVDHEAALIHGKLKVLSEVATDFGSLLLSVIENRQNGNENAL